MNGTNPSGLDYAKMREDYDRISAVFKDVRQKVGDDLTNPSGIEPLEYNVVVLPAKVEERTKGGLIRPDELREREQWAEIQGTLIAAAPAAFDDFGAEPMLGDTVIHARHAGVLVKGRDGIEYRVVKDKDIIAVMRHE